MPEGTAGKAKRDMDGDTDRTGMQETQAAILEALSDGPVGGPALAADLGVSRAAVWKQIESLREAGFDISGTPAGYVLESVPEYGGDAVAFGLDAPYEVEYHDRIESTNARARELAKRGREDVVVLADEQTGGRGRLGREWVSPGGGIWLSVLLRPAVPATHAPVFTLLAGVATARTVEGLGLDASIKWPNDVLVEGKKLAGVLTEMEGEADRVSWLVVGVGVNANVDPGELPDERPVTSLQAEAGPVDRRAVTQELLERFEKGRRDLDGVLDVWRGHSSTLGRRVSVRLPDEEVVGRAVDVEFPGALVVETDDGTRTVSAGDCTHLRPDRE